MDKKTYMGAYYQRNKAAIRQRQAAYRAAKPEYHRRRNRAYRDRHKDDERDRALRQAYWTPEQFYAALSDQYFRCACCDCDLLQLPSRLIHADHDDDRKAPRGILCQWCNIGIGHFGDDPVRLRAAAMYLEKHA